MPLRTHRPTLAPAPEVHLKDERIQNFYSKDWWVRALLLAILFVLMVMATGQFAHGQSPQTVGLYWWNGTKFVPANATNPLPVSTSGTSPISGTVTANQGTAGASPWPVTPTPASSASEAVTPCNILSTASTNATSCKASAGNFFGFEIYNTTTTVYYLRLYNSAASPTCSSATGFVRTIPIPPGASSGLVGGVVSNQHFPTNYATGIGYCITGGSSSTDNTNAAAGIFGEIRYE